MQTVLPPVPLPEEALTDVPFSVSSFLVSFPGQKATPNCLEKVIPGDGIPDTSPDPAGLCLTPPGFGSSGCSGRSTTTQRSSRLKRRVLYLQGFEHSLKVIFKNDLLPLNQSLYPYVIVALSCPSALGLEPFADLSWLLADPK